MSYRPTPETDAFSIQLKTICGQKKWVPVDFARQLERSRDEWAAMCGRYKQERDEAREVFREMWQSGDAFLPHVDQATTNRWRNAAGWEETK